MPDVPQAELDSLIVQRDTALTQVERFVEAAFGDWVDTREYLTDTPGWYAYGSGTRAVSTTSLDDRKDGSFRPVYECEQDLAFIRAGARNLRVLTGIASGALDALANYTFSGGFSFEAAPEDENNAQAIQLVAAVQKVIDRFVDENDFAGVIDREIDRRAREDGECLVAFDEYEIAENGKIVLEFLEPDQLTQPLNNAQLEEWIEYQYPSCFWPGPNCWKFGVQTPEGKTWKPLGYHIVRDGKGADWDYYPAYRVEHIKRNVTRNAKRGVSDFLELAEYFCDEAKLNKNMRRGAALQSAIAWILQGAQGTTQSQLSSVGGESRRISNLPSPLGPNATTTIRNASNYPPGSILKVPFGQEYLAGPMGAERNQGFELVGQYVLRAIGVRWNMPEYIISGDASNANYSSTLVSGSPFSEARKADQQFYKRHFLSLIWKVIRVHCESGRFDRFGITREGYTQLESLVRIDCECPTVDVRDPKLAVDSDKVLVDSGVMSKQTFAARNGLDYDKEQKLGALEKPPEPVISPFGGPPQPKQPPQPGQEGQQGDQRPPAPTVKAAINESLLALQEAYP
jgi:hypothetical protein